MRYKNQNEEGLDEVERVRRQVEAVRERIRQISQPDPDQSGQPVKY